MFIIHKQVHMLKKMYHELTPCILLSKDLSCPHIHVMWLVSYLCPDLCFLHEVCHIENMAVLAACHYLNHMPSIQYSIHRIDILCLASWYVEDAMLAYGAFKKMNVQNNINSFTCVLRLFFPLMVVIWIINN